MDNEKTVNASAILASTVNDQIARETVVTFEGSQVFREIAKMSGNNPNRFGNLYEAIETLKFNKAAVRANSKLHADVTARPASADLKPSVSSPHDVLIRGDGTTSKHQLGASLGDKSHARLATKMRDEKYHGMKRVVPKDQFDKTKELTEIQAGKKGNIYSEEYNDSARNLEPELKHGKARSGGTSTDEIRAAGNDPEKYITTIERNQIVKEIGYSAGSAAVVGGVISGAISTVGHLTRLHAGELSGKETAVAILRDTGKGAVRGGLVGGTGAAIRIGAQKIGVSQLSQVAPATTLAALAVDTGVVIWTYARGEISNKEAVSRLSQSGVATCSSLFISSGVASVMTAPALITGGVAFAGYLIGSACYNACKTVLKEAKLAEEEQKRIELLCEEAMEELNNLETQMHNLYKKKITKRKDEFALMMRNLNRTFELDDYESHVNVLVLFSKFAGESLQMIKFEDFNEFMLSDTSLLL